MAGQLNESVLIQRIIDSMDSAIGKEQCGSDICHGKFVLIVHGEGAFNEFEKAADEVDRDAMW